MSRWEPNARERLEQAALELFVEQGFAETTVPQITARAGLTTRTFFRHFADKREVLFSGEEELPALVATLMAEAPPELEPMTMIVQGLVEFAKARFEGRREYLLTRRAVVRTDPGLIERDLRKMADLADVIEAGFRNRGVDALTSAVAARLGVAVFNVATQGWLDQDGDRPLADFVSDAVAAMRSVTADG